MRPTLARAVPSFGALKNYRRKLTIESRQFLSSFFFTLFLIELNLLKRALAMNIPLRKETSGLLALLIVVSAAVIWIRILTVKETYAYVRAEKELRRTEQELQDVRLKLIKVTAPSRLQNKAGELGLGVPENNQVIKWGRIQTAQYKGRASR